MWALKRSLLTFCAFVLFVLFSIACVCMLGRGCGGGVCVYWGCRHTTPFTLPLKAFNRKLTLQLSPSRHLLLPDAVLEHTDVNGVTTTKPLSSHGYYSGHIVGSNASHAHVSVSPEGASPLNRSTFTF